MRKYDIGFKNEAVKLAAEIGRSKAAKELSLPQSTLDTWIKKFEEGTLAGAPANPKAALSLAEEVKRLKQEIKELKRTNEILSKATAFFAQSQKK